MKNIPSTQNLSRVVTVTLIAIMAIANISCMGDTSNTGSGSTSGGADVVFLGSEAKLVSKLKKAEKMIIEAEFFDSGLHQITFTTKGFKWE